MKKNYLVQYSALFIPAFAKVFAFAKATADDIGRRSALFLHSISLP